MRRDIWYGGSEGSDDLLFSLILLHCDISAAMFFHVAPCSETMLFIFFDDYLWLKKIKKISQTDFWANLSKFGPFSKSKAWAEAYNGLEFLEEAAFFHFAFSIASHFLWHLKTQLYNKELT